MFSRRVSGRTNRRNIPSSGAVFAGNFATFAKALGLIVVQGFQPDLGLTEGTTPLATAGNTSTTVLTLSGTRTGLPVPIWAKSTNSLAIGSGATFNIYYDGTGTTPAMTAVTPTAGVGVGLTGAGAGLTLTWAAGTSVTNDTWKAQIATLPDPIGGFPATQATVGNQPLISAGTNGRTSILGNGAGQFMTSTLTLPAPGTTPTTIWSIVKLISTSASSILCLDGSGTGTAIQIDATPNLQGYNGVSFSSAALAATGVLRKLEVSYTNSVADYAQWGVGAKATGTNMGNNASAATRGLLARNTGVNGFNGELQVMLTIAANGNNIGPQLAALTAAANTYFATTVG